MAKSDALATVVLPNLVEKHAAFVAHQALEQERVAAQLAQITTNYTSQIMQLENHLRERELNSRNLENQIRNLNNQLIEQINATNQQRALNDQQLNHIRERDEVIAGFGAKLKQVSKDNEVKIQTKVQVILKFYF